MASRWSSVLARGTVSTDGPWDVVVVGGGNAALVAAIAARLEGARVLVLERAPREARGGNSRHTRDVRHVHESWPGKGSYSYDELWDDLCNVGSGPSNEKLAALTVAASEAIPSWMSGQGVRWQGPLQGTLHLARTNSFFLGGGKALLNTYYRRAELLGVTVVYGATVTDLVFEGDRCRRVVFERDGRSQQVATSTVVCASGGYEANIDWLAQSWGEAARNFIIRGSPFNDGTVLRCLYQKGAACAGEEKGFHAVAVDARAPRFDGGIVTRLDTIPFGIAVDRRAQRFYDEGEDLWPKRYAIWGSRIAEQDGQIAYSLWDSKAAGLFIPSMYPPVEAGSISDLAGRLGLARPRLPTPSLASTHL